MSSGSLESELRKEAAVPWKSACRLSGMCMSFCTLVTESMAPPSEAPGAMLKETVTEGNCPWWVMESGSVVVSKWAMALSGTALLGVELLVPAALTPCVVPLTGAITRAGAVIVPAEGVYAADSVMAFEPAGEEPEGAKELDRKST